MPRELDFHDISLFLGLFSFAVFGMALYMVYLQQPGGLAIVAQGGNYTKLDIQVREPVFEWTFAYGNFTSGAGNTSITTSGGDVFMINITGDNDSYWIIAADHPVNISEISPTSPALVDSFIGIDPSEQTSATNTFKELINYTIRNKTYEAWSTDTISESGNYTTVLFNDSHGFVFITNRVNGTGFDGGKSDFQILLPIPVSGNITYSLSVLSNESAPSMECVISMNLSAHLSEDLKAVVTWDAVPGALSYTVYYQDNITDPDNTSRYLFNFSGGSSVLGITSLNWTDPASDSVSERYYSVSAISGTEECKTDEIAGIINLNLTKKDEIGYNFITTPLELDDDNFTRLLEPIIDQVNNAYWYDNELKNYKDFSLFCFMGTCIPIDNIKHFMPKNSYWIEVSSDAILPIVGKVLNKTTLDLTPQYNAVGFHIIEGERSASSVFNQIYPDLNNVFGYDNTDKLYRQFSLFCFMGTCVPVGDLKYVEYTVSYWIDIKSGGQLQWP